MQITGESSRNGQDSQERNWTSRKWLHWQQFLDSDAATEEQTMKNAEQ